MIYLDNAATTYPKPPQVISAVQFSMRRLGANPGRSGYKMSMDASEEIYKCRRLAADFFNAPGPECVAFPLNCTQALNMVIKGLLKPGDHVVTSDIEHNAVMRPLETLAQQKLISYTAAKVTPGDNDATVDAFRAALTEKTRLIVCTHASNVWGIRVPIERISALASEYDIPMVVDCAQSAGTLPIDMQNMGISYLCAAGHKGLYGPMGTGILLAQHGENLATIIEGGTGSESYSLLQPQAMPDRFESGTLNVPGISGLRAGISFVLKKKPEVIYRHEMGLIQELYRKLKTIPQVKLYTPLPEEPYYVPVLSFNVGNVPSEEIGAQLAKKGIAVRCGLHCAPMAHQKMGTLEQGAVRVCPSAFSNMNEINTFVLSLMKIIKQLDVK